MSLKRKEIFEFGDYRLDIEERTIERLDGRKCEHLPEKAFQALAILVTRRGHLVTKDELVSELWRDTIVEDNNLDKRIYQIRHFLGEEANGSKFVETVRKRGYRFVGDVRTVEVSSSWLPETYRSEDDLVAVDPNTVNPIRSDLAKENPASNKTAIALIVIPALFLSLGAMAYIYYSRSSTEGKRSFAVLPLKPIDSANRSDLYEIGIADSMIQNLSLFDGLIVRPLDATRKYSDLNQDPVSAGRDQQVDYVVATNYQLQDGKVRVSVQIYNVANGEVEEAYQTDSDAVNVFAAQDAIAAELGRRLIARFGVVRSGVMAHRGTNNEEAYRLYLEGIYKYDKRTQGDFRKAIEVFEQAIQLDPNYALAWAGKAHAHRALANFGRNTNIQDEYQRSIDAISKALELDPNLSEAYSALCENKFLYEYDFVEAERQCKRALELKMDSSMAHEIYARFLWSRGRHNESISEIKTAVDLEPSSLFNQRNLGAAFYYARRYGEAVAQFKRVIEMDDKFMTAYFWLVDALVASGNELEAFDYWMKALALQKTDEATIQAYRSAFQAEGWHGVLQENIKRFEAGDQQYFHGARYLARAGDRDRAIEFLERSYSRREAWMAQAGVHPDLDALRGDPRFVELVKRVESR